MSIDESLVIRAFFLSIILLLYPLNTILHVQASNPIEVVVFEDSNGNGVFDSGETPLGGVRVSNMEQIVLTDGSGKTILEPGPYNTIYVSIPSGYTNTTPWFYRVVDFGGRLVFGLKTVEQSRDFFIVQLTDIHLAEDPGEVREVFKNNATVNPYETFIHALEEVKSIKGEIVLAVTGDIVVDSNYPETEDVIEWYSLYLKSLRSILGDVRVISVPGNHDVHGISNPSISPDDPDYGLNLYRSILGPEYYSLDYSNVHIVVLSPHIVVGRDLIYSFPEEEVKWLEEDLELSGNKSIIVLVHEPPINWVKDHATMRVLELLNSRRATILCGHWHVNAYFEYENLRIFVSASLSASWWAGLSRDGSSSGYTVYRWSGDGIERFFKPVGQTIVFELVSPRNIALNEGTIDLYLSVWPEDTDVSFEGDGVVDNFTIVYSNGLWRKIRVPWNLTNVMPGWRSIVVSGGGFSREFYYYVTNDSVPYSQIIKMASKIYGRKYCYMGFYTGYNLAKYTYILHDNASAILLGANYIKRTLSLSNGDIVYFEGMVMIPREDMLLKDRPVIEVFEEPSIIGRADLKPVKKKISELSENTPLVEVEGDVESSNIEYYVLRDSSGTVKVVDLTRSYRPDKGAKLRVKGVPVEVYGNIVLLSRGAEDVSEIVEGQTPGLNLLIYAILIVIVLLMIFFKGVRRK